MLETALMTQRDRLWSLITAPRKAHSQTWRILVIGAPSQFDLLAGQEHGRTIPLADIYRVIRDYLDQRRKRMCEGEAKRPSMDPVLLSSR